MIDDVEIIKLDQYDDKRGWLVELWRQDMISPEYFPVMAYISETLPNVQRGPHEHRAQTDLFCFVSGRFMLELWDNRHTSQTYRGYSRMMVGEGNKTAVIVPPGIIHAYTNTGDKPATVINCPNQLYKGVNKDFPVDEIRYEG